MSQLAKISVEKQPRKLSGTVVILAGDGARIGPAARNAGLEPVVSRAAAVMDFKGKAMSTLDLPTGVDGIDRLIVVGIGKPGELKELDWLRLGGVAAGAVGRGKRAGVLLERPDGKKISPESAADFALGARLRSYAFDKYKTAKDDSANGGGKEPPALVLWHPEAGQVRRAVTNRDAIAEGVALARDLVNEPPNVLGPVEFVERIQELAAIGVEIEVLTEDEMKAAGMSALLGVAQGSSRPARIAVMRWNGGRSKDQPVAFVGKGVVFDTGGISIKPAAGMEDMKGDMAGAAAVTGLMRTLAGRKAKVNAVGVVGLVENMPDGNAQRPGDIVKAMTGKTIEIINTDAEGRLVLADAVAYTEDRFKPQFIIDLATLTGAIVVALGHQLAGMFSSDDKLAAGLTAAGEATGERVWRMPLAPEYDKLIDSRFADVKNSGGRNAGSITGAHFIKRFVKSVPWVHLDIAGTAMDSPQTEINRSWSSGWGVRLLDRLVADRYER